MKTIRAKPEAKVTLRLLRTTWPTLNRRKTFNLSKTQSFVLMLRFRCSSPRCFLNSLTRAASWNTTNES